MGSSATTDNGDRSGKRRRSLSKLVQIAFVLVAVGLATWAVASRWSQVSEAWSRVTVWPMLAAMALATAGSYASFPSWRLLLAGLGSPLPVAPARRVFFLGQLGKYVPGGVWAVIAQVTLARALHVPRARSASASLLTILIGIVSSGSLGALCLLIGGREVLGRYAPALLLIVVLIVLLHPGLLVRLAALASRVTGRNVHIDRIPGRTIAASVGIQITGLVLLGLHFYFVIGTVGGTYVSPILAIGLLNVSLAAGMLAVFAPAGAGVREAILTLGLSPFMSPGSALLIALMSRVLTIIADVLVAGGAALLGRTRPVSEPAPDDRASHGTGR